MIKKEHQLNHLLNLFVHNTANMVSSMQEELFKGYSFPHFSRFPPEIRNRVWEISVQDYPARIVDLREYRQSVSPAKHIVGFKSRAPAPTVIYACRESRSIAQRAYSKAFGTSDMPAEIWIDFDKDMLYISKDFCYAGLLGAETNTDRFDYISDKQLRGYFVKDLKEDITKVKDLAISGFWNLGSDPPWSTAKISNMKDIYRVFHKLERFTFVDNQHTPDLRTDLVFAEESYISRDPQYEYLMSYRGEIFDNCFCDEGDGEIWAGLEPYPWYEFAVLVNRHQEGVTSILRPRKTESRLATDDDRHRAMPDPETYVWWHEGILNWLEECKKKQR